MTALFQGWTPSYPAHQRMQNAIESAQQFLVDDVGNAYWQSAVRRAEQDLLGFYEVQARPAALAVAITSPVLVLEGIGAMEELR